MGHVATAMVFMIAWPYINNLTFCAELSQALALHASG